MYKLITIYLSVININIVLRLNLIITLKKSSFVLKPFQLSGI